MKEERTGISNPTNRKRWWKSIREAQACNPKDPDKVPVSLDDARFDQFLRNAGARIEPRTRENSAKWRNQEASFIRTERAKAFTQTKDTPARPPRESDDVDILSPDAPWRKVSLKKKK